MWHMGDYRIVFRHEVFPSAKQVEKAMIKMADKGYIKYPTTSSIKYTQMMSVVVLQKRITQDGLTAWATLGVGYSFCQDDDQFCKWRGRLLAFVRANDQVATPHHAAFVEMWNHNAGPQSRIVHTPYGFLTENDWKHIQKLPEQRRCDVADRLLIKC